MQFDRKVLEGISQEENIPVRVLEKGLDDGSIVILRNQDSSRYMWIGDRGVQGEALTTKINVNVGLSSASPNLDRVLASVSGLNKLAPGRVTFMDLSSYGLNGSDDFSTSRRAIMDATKSPVGTVPIYEAVHHARKRSGNPVDVNLDAGLML